MAFASSTSVHFRNKPKPKRICARRLKNQTRMTLETSDYVKEVERYLSNIAKTEKPPYLDALIYVLTSTSESKILSPSARNELHPFFIPLTYDSNEEKTTGLLRWPTPPDDFPLPIVSCTRGDPCLTLLSSCAKSHVTRALARADFSGNYDHRDEIRTSSSLSLAYQNGDVEKSGLGLERFLISATSGFPDLYEGLVEFHAAKGDESSALITCERAAQSQNGWARPHAYHAKLLQKLGRELEAKDAARFCLTLPLWTMGNISTLLDMGTLAGYQDKESLGKIYRRLFEDGRIEEIKDGKSVGQVALDRAAWLLDVCVAEQQSQPCQEGWENIRERLAELYDEAGMNDFATFVRY